MTYIIENENNPLDTKISYKGIIINISNILISSTFWYYEE